MDCTWMDCTWMDCTWVDCTWMDCTWVDCTWMDCTWVDCTWILPSLNCSFLPSFLPSFPRPAPGQPQANTKLETTVRWPQVYPKSLRSAPGQLTTKYCHLFPQLCQTHLVTGGQPGGSLGLAWGWPGGNEQPVPTAMHCHGSGNSQPAHCPVVQPVMSDWPIRDLTGATI